jgi:hypothetical protein
MQITKLSVILSSHFLFQPQEPRKHETSGLHGTKIQVVFWVKTEEARSSQTISYHQDTWRHNPEDRLETRIT